MFGNLKLLQGFNTKLLKELKEVVEKWSNVSTIGGVFVRFAPFLKMYAEYSNKYEEALQLFLTTYEKNQAFQAVSLPSSHSSSLSSFIPSSPCSPNQAVNKIREDSAIGYTVPDLLIMPIQRIPRYSLLLRDLSSKTAEGHPDYSPLKEALQLIEDVAIHVNEQVRFLPSPPSPSPPPPHLSQVRRSENQKRVEEFQAKGVALGPLVKPHRFMIKEGLVKVTVTPTESGLLLRPELKPVKELHQFILFNDVFVHVRKDALKSGAPFRSCPSHPFTC